MKLPIVSVLCLVASFCCSGTIFCEELTVADLHSMIVDMKVRQTEETADMMNIIQSRAEKAEKDLQAAIAELKKLKKTVDTQNCSTIANNDLVSERPGLYLDYTFYRVTPDTGGGSFLIRDENNDSNRVRGYQYYIPHDRTSGGEYSLGVRNADGSGLELSFFSSDGTGDTGRISVDPGATLWGTWLHPNSVIDDNDVDAGSALSRFSYSNFAFNGWQPVSTSGKAQFKWVAGVRNSKLEYKVNVAYVQELVATVTRVSNASEYNKLQGTGPRLGFKMDLPLDSRSGLSLNLEGAGSLVRCRRSFHRFEEDGSIFTDGTPSTVRDRIDIETDSQKTNVSVLDFTAGLTYKRMRRTGSAVRMTIGYRYETWKDAIQEMRSSDDVDSQLASTSNQDMSFSGAFFKFGFSF